jgi:hypothetical protein
MTRILRSALGLVVMGLTFSVAVADDTKADKDKKDATDKLLSKSGTVSGKLIEWGSNQKYLVMQVPVEVPNPSGIENELNLQRELAQALLNNANNLPARARQVADIEYRIAQNKRNLVKEETVRMEFQAGEDMIVRLRDLPVTFDDKGKPKKPTEKDKQERKGPDPKLPGYTAGLEDLKSEQIVTVYVSKPKDAPKATGKDKDAVKNVEKPTVKMVVIERDPNN